MKTRAWNLRRRWALVAVVALALVLAVAAACGEEEKAPTAVSALPAGKR